MNTGDITANTRICAVLGYPVRHSASPVFQNAGIRTAGLDLRYVAFEVRPEALPSAIEGCKALGFIGINLTVPHKETAAKLVDEIDPHAKILGAINTIRFEGWQEEAAQWLPIYQCEQTALPRIRTVGFNTDAQAITDALQTAFDFHVQGQKVVLFGTGGAGRVAALQLAHQGVAKLYLVNRTAVKAEKLADEIKTHYPATEVQVGYPQVGEKVSLAINATSCNIAAGGTSETLPFDTTRFQFSQASFAFDMFYQPEPTAFLRLAKNAGCGVANGADMLLYQGVASLKIWTGLPNLPISVMRESMNHWRYSEWTTR